jgi:hypothetical protein
MNRVPKLPTSAIGSQARSIAHRKASSIRSDGPSDRRALNLQTQARSLGYVPKALRADHADKHTRWYPPRCVPHHSTLRLSSAIFPLATCCESPTSDGTFFSANNENHERKSGGIRRT